MGSDDVRARAEAWAASEVDAYPGASLDERIRSWMHGGVHPDDVARFVVDGYEAGHRAALAAEAAGASASPVDAATVAPATAQPGAWQRGHRPDTLRPISVEVCETIDLVDDDVVFHDGEWWVILDHPENDGRQVYAAPIIDDAGGQDEPDFIESTWFVRVVPLYAAPPATGDAAAVRPEVVCLCGSTRFIDTFAEQYGRLTDEGKIVLTVGRVVPQSEQALGSPRKAALDTLHLRKIDLADRVLVLNVGGYVGPSTRREIAYAKERGKPIDLLYPDAGLDGVAPVSPAPRGGAVAHRPGHRPPVGWRAVVEIVSASDLEADDVIFAEGRWLCVLDDDLNDSTQVMAAEIIDDAGGRGVSDTTYGEWFARVVALVPQHEEP